jgi:hypothetical protein
VPVALNSPILPEEYSGLEFAEELTVLPLVALCVTTEIEVVDAIRKSNTVLAASSKVYISVQTHLSFVRRRRRAFNDARRELEKTG